MKDAYFTPEERKAMADELKYLRGLRRLPGLYKREEIRVKTERDIVKEEGRA